MDKNMETLLANADTFTLITIDNRGFPNAIAVSPPLERNGFYYFKFYINGMVELLKTFDTIVLAVSSVLTKTSMKVLH